MSNRIYIWGNLLKTVCCIDANILQFFYIIFCFVTLNLKLFFLDKVFFAWIKEANVQSWFSPEPWDFDLIPRLIARPKCWLYTALISTINRPNWHSDAIPLSHRMIWFGQGRGYRVQQAVYFSVQGTVRYSWSGPDQVKFNLTSLLYLKDSWSSM